jgi:hypothetical protein
VRFVVMDRGRDLWHEGVYYDFGVSHLLRANNPLRLGDLADSPATHVGVVSRWRGPGLLTQGTDVGEIEVVDRAGGRVLLPMRIGESTGPGGDLEPVRVDEGGPVYVRRLALPGPMSIDRLEIRAVGADQSLEILGLSLLDARTDANHPVPLSPDLRYSLMGDVKIYENLAVMPRAFVVHRLVGVDGDHDALAYLRSPDFKPASEAVILSADMGGEERSLIDATPPDPANARVEIASYSPESVNVSVSNSRAGLLVLTDAYYPGWEVTIDGQPVPIRRVNHMFRGVAVPAGEHSVTFNYRPATLRSGLIVSLATLAVMLLAIALPVSRRWRLFHPVK